MASGGRPADAVLERDAPRRSGDSGGPPILYRLGRWAALHPWRVLPVWGLLLVLAALSAGTFSSRLTAQSNAVDGSDSARAAQIARRALPAATAETDFAVVRSGTRTAEDPRFRTVVGNVVAAYRAADQVRQVIDPYTAGAALISADRHTALVAVGVTGDAKRAAEPLQAVAARLGDPEVTVAFTGYSPLAVASVQRADEDLGRAESIGLPVAALVLLVAFGSLVAAALPLTLGVTAILASFGLLGVLSHAMEFSTVARAAVTMLAIALGIDYSLFIVTRFREELAGATARARDAGAGGAGAGGTGAGRTGAGGRAMRAEAVGRTMATAGRAVLFSGGTVMISLAGLFLVRSSGPRAIAVGMMVTVLALLLIATTLLPAVLGLLGRRVNSLALPGMRRSLAHPDPERSGWARLAAAVMRRPVVVAAGVTAALALLALPTLGLRYGVDTGAEAVRDSPAGRGYATLSAAFAPGVLAPVTVVAASPRGPLSDTQLDAVDAFGRTVSADERAATVTSPIAVLDQRFGGHDAVTLRTALSRSPAEMSTMVSRDATTVAVTVYPRHASDAEDTQALVASVRNEAARTLRGAGLDAHVGGGPAQIADISAENSRATPLVIGAILAASWVLLLLVFRSLVLPVKAIVMNLLSVGAAFGVVVLVFQDGHGAALLGVHRTGFIQVMLPLLTFAVAFGLSMDYEVFMLSRMREEWQRTGDNTTAVRLGITHTARVITSAALIMVAVFASFVLAGMLETKQLGFMLALAVLLDATVVRLLLVPALMRLMGRWNWWLPRLPTRRPAAVR